MFIIIVVYLNRYHQRPKVLYTAGKIISKCNNSALVCTSISRLIICLIKAWNQPEIVLPRNIR